MVDTYPQYRVKYTFALGDNSLAAVIVNQLYFPSVEPSGSARYIGTKTRAQTYLGIRSDAQMYLGTGLLFPV